MNPVCPCCKTDKWVEEIGLNFTAPQFMTDAKWICTHCCGYMNGQKHQDCLLLQYGWVTMYWEGL